MKRWFLNNEDALVFCAKVNSRREHLAHYEHALKGNVTDSEREFLERVVASLTSQVAALLDEPAQ